MEKKKGFSLKEKLKHYTEVANGKKKTKSESKYSDAEQKAYARGQRDARNEQRRIWKSNNSTPEEKQAYKDKNAIRYAGRVLRRNKRVSR